MPKLSVELLIVQYDGTNEEEVVEALKDGRTRSDDAIKFMRKENDIDNKTVWLNTGEAIQKDDLIVAVIGTKWYKITTPRDFKNDFGDVL